ncbi:MAG: alpha/beta fold hydrolase [Roseibium sp.]|uniref:alpha/beta hydrolase n=1 Tax=Roseibium sp. TaxID=1936156 RepID=UPI003299F9B3
MKGLKTIALGASAVYLTALTAAYTLQRHMQYFPSTMNPSPAEMGLEGVSVETIRTPDGEDLVAWYAPATKKNRHTVLFFHGNMGEMAHRADRFRFWQSRGYGVLFLSARGYGGSSGEITEKGLIIDAVASYDWLVEAKVPAEKIVLIGESLGTGLAVQLAAQRPVAAVLLEAPYTATVDVAADIYPFFPVRFLMLDQLKSIDHIDQINAPLLIQHGETDQVVPYKFGKRLFEAAKEPKEMVPLAEQGHGVIMTRPVWMKELSFIEALSKKAL